jgi:glyoxylase-like metal-dependent hydrolase (beta-lactamase superfamily II)
MVFAGDHIMNGSTVVIVPPGGNMADYIASLRRLLDYRRQGGRAGPR